MALPHPLFLALVALWIASEAYYGRRRAADRGRAHDRGSLRILHASILAGVASAVWLAGSGNGGFAPALRTPLLLAGCAAMAAGLAVRAWAVRTLAELFTVDVAIQQGHRLVRDGPYRWLRHPSYTGSLLTFLGFALGLGNAWALPAVMLPVAAAFAWRIRIEERVLREAFPEQWPAYARGTWRVLPLIW